MKIKIDFTKLLCETFCHFNLDIELEMINWFLATSLKGDYEEQKGWNRSGINQLLYGYSANNESHKAKPFPIENGNLRDFITSIFVRAIVSPVSWDGKGRIEKWRKDNKIGLGKYRFLDFPEKSGNDPRRLLWDISAYKNKELKKEFAHPEYPNRTKPKIIDVKFSTYGEGYYVLIEFSFWEFNYEPGWTEEIAWQEPNEYIGDFLARAKEKLKTITVNSEATERLAFETKHNFQTYSEKGCFNCIWKREELPGCYCGKMAFYKKTDSCFIDDPKNHCCDEWDFSYDENTNPQNYITRGNKET